MLASQFSVQAGEKDQIKFVFLKRFLRSVKKQQRLSSDIASGPGGGQLRGRTCVPGFCSEDAGYASWHSHRLHSIQSNAHTVQVADHPNIKFFYAHSQGVVRRAPTGFTLLKVEISSYTKFFHCLYIGTRLSRLYYDIFAQERSRCQFG